MTCTIFIGWPGAGVRPMRNERRAVGAELLHARDALAHGLRVLAAVHARLERGGIEPRSLRDRDNLIGGLGRCLEQLGVQLPELALVLRAAGRFVRPERVGMQLIDRIVDEDVTDLAGVDELRVDLRLRLLEVAPAERAVVIGNLHQGQLRGCLSVDWRAA